MPETDKPIKLTRYQGDQKAAQALANALTKLPDEWIACRDYRHSWTVQDDFFVEGANNRRVREVKRTLVCLRCHTLRHEFYHLTRGGLEKMKQHYEYPEHYQIKGVPRGNKPQSIVQNEVYRRSLEKIATRARGA